jgi:hypothetical protein
VRSYVLLRIKNMLLGLLTLGFYRPFALVSEYRMKTESVTLHVKGAWPNWRGKWWPNKAVWAMPWPTPWALTWWADPPHDRPRPDPRAMVRRPQ